jgi:hypothetical protein
MKKIFYEKVGKKYVPVKEFDSDFTDALPHGHHLIYCRPGLESRKYNIDPNYAALIAASRIAEEVIVKSILRTSELRPVAEPYTKEEIEAWENFRMVSGDKLSILRGSSIQECVDAGIKAMIHEAHKLLQNESTRIAYEQFMLIATLSEEKK